jgi:hypothetical protein
MRKRLVYATALLAGVSMMAGCSATSAGFTAFGVGKNLLRKDSYLKIVLDGQPAKQNKLKKAAVGYSRFDVKERVGTAPKLQFEIMEPDKFGRITNVNVQIHQKFEADYSDHAEFSVTARDLNNPQAQMKPNTTYDLGAPGPNFKVINYKGEEVPGVKLTPGMKYMLVLTVKADKSETAQIFLETR